MTDRPLTRDEATQVAADELARDADLLGEPITPGAGTETPGFWIFRPTSEAFAAGESTDSLSHRLPPVVVDRRTGQATRPFAAGQRFLVTELGADEWIILPPSDPTTAPADTDGLDFTDDDLAALGRLAHFRLRRAGRDDGDRLEATLVATDPRLIENGLADVGIRRADGEWMVPGAGSDERVRVTWNAETATVGFTLSGNGSTDSPWTIGPRDLRLAALVEAALADADWVRFWA